MRPRHLERNDHFDNLYQKAKLYKETFVEIVFDNVEYDPDNEDQTWLEQYGLIKNRDGFSVVGNNIYKARYTKTFYNYYYQAGDKKVTGFTIGIGKDSWFVTIREKVVSVYSWSRAFFGCPFFLPAF